MRRMMFAVAVVACCVGLIVGLQRRAERFHLLADDHERAAVDLIMQAGGPVSATDLPDGGLEELMWYRGEGATRAWRASEYHEELVEKYRRAARLPGFPSPMTRPSRNEWHG
ncbi:MAG: hypothetical protein WKF75_10615 [Singulisphaera sp.]